CRNADPAHRPGADVPARSVCSRRRIQGGAHRRRRRRNLWRLRDFQGGEAPSLLVEASGITASSAVAIAPVSLHAGAETPAAGVPRGLLPRQARRRGASLFFAPAALAPDLA